MTTSENLNSLYKILLLQIVLLLAVPVYSKSVIPFSRDRASSVAVIVRDLRTGRDLVSQNPHKAMLPASTMKCVTSAAAIVAGLDTARFRTDVNLCGPVDNGVLNGNLIVMGAGDPTIESGQFPGNSGFPAKIAAAVRDAGIRRIRGEITVDQSGFPDNGPCDRWELSDVRYDYGAGLYGMNFRDNRHGDKAVESPAEAFGEALENSLLAEGIAVDWDETDISGETPRLLLSHESPRGDEILRNLMCRSDNLFAEGILRQLAPGQSRKAAISRERSLLASKGIDFDITDIYDGSGLSRNNRVTAQFMADLLEKMAPVRGAAASYVSLFPKVGREGTVRNLFKKHPLTGRLALKSGSMNGVHCYAGYKLDAEGNPTHAVVILVNDFFCKRDEVRNSISRFLESQFKNDDN